MEIQDFVARSPQLPKIPERPQLPKESNLSD
jgi:hypothetical protein